MATTPIELTEAEHAALSELLNEYSQRLSNDGCNDMPLDDTPANRALLKEIDEAEGWDEDVISAHNGRIYADNQAVLSHLMRKLGVREA